MPELPEVEAARRAVEENCVGKRIKRAVVADDPKVIDAVSPSDFQSSLIGRTIIAARRKGKNMWLQLDSPPFPSFQFGMAGAIYIKGVAVTKYKRSAVNDSDEWPSKYSKVFIELDDGLELSFTDKRRFAKVRLLENPESMPPISELGPDALFEPMKEDEFVDSLSKKKIAIKALLLDQNFIAGIGNWIADEVLYQARIHPLQSAESLPEEKCKDLFKSINEVIQKAVVVGADSTQFPNNWIFHSREKKPDKAFIDGKKIEFITVGGRTSAFVPELQKLTGAQAANVHNKKREAETRQDDHEDKKGRKAKSKAMQKPKKNSDDEIRDQVDEDKAQNTKSNARKNSKTQSITEKAGPIKTAEVTKKRVMEQSKKKTKIGHSDDDSDDDDDNNEYSNDDSDEPKKGVRTTKRQTKVINTMKKGTKSGKTNAVKKKARK